MAILPQSSPQASIPMSTSSTMSNVPSNGLAPAPSEVDIIPVTPLTSSRYNPMPRIDIPKRPKFLKGRHKGTGLDRANIQDLGTQLPNWKKYIHPDGKPYFHDHQRRIVTEIDVRKEDQRKLLEDLYGRLDIRRVHPISQEERTCELYLDLPPNAAGSYYFVNHSTQDIIWLEDYDEDTLKKYKIINDNEPKVSDYDIFILRNYYGHLENFPCHNTLPAEASGFLHGALTYTCTDHMTSHQSATTPWNADDAKVFLDLLESLDEKHKDNQEVKKADQPDYTSSYRTWFVARLLGLILHSRSIHRHGKIDALTDRMNNVKHAGWNPIDYMLGCLTFFTHLSYVQRLENIWAEGVVSCASWQSLVSALLIEWSDTNLLATVVLSANMAFLALSDLNNNARTSSIVSTFFAIGSIIIGMHHVWKHREKRDSVVEQAGTYFANAWGRSGTFKPLAFYLCLPLILLLWSLVVFTCTIGIYTFGSNRSRAMYVLAGGILSVVVIMVGVTIRFFSNICSPMGSSS